MPRLLGNYTGDFLAQLLGSGPSDALPPAVGLYASQGDIENLIGIDSLAVMSDVDANEPGGGVDVPRVQLALDWAAAEIHRLFRGFGIFTVPLANLGTDSAIIMRDVQARLAAWWLYQNRGVKDYAKDAASPERLKGVAGLFENHRKIAFETIAGIHRFPRQLAADRIGAAHRPIAVGVADPAYTVLVPDARRTFPFPTN